MSKPPIWAVAAPGSRKPRFTREQIAQTAFKIADSEGFEALSMRRVADELGAGTMTLYYYVRTKEDLLALVDDALMGEICDACDPLPKTWRPAVRKLATATRATFVRHAWALLTPTGLRMGPNGLRHIEQSLQAVASVELPHPELFAVLSFLNSPAFLTFVRRLTGDERPVFCDAMATRYLPGHFLTAHDDEAPGENRLYAYVLNLTGRWRADWGGMLLFLDDQDHVAEGYVPAFNALNIFRVPQRHAVSFVTPYAGAARLSITGWIRSKPPPGWPPH